MEDFVYVVVLLLISAIPAIQKGIQKKSKLKKKRMSASGNITNVITSDSAISLSLRNRQRQQRQSTDGLFINIPAVKTNRRSVSFPKYRLNRNKRSKPTQYGRISIYGKPLSIRRYCVPNSDTSIYFCNMATIFTKIINGEIPSYKIAEDDKHYAFLDINPVVEGHTLVVPKKENDYLFNLEDDELADLMVFAKKVARKLETKIECKRIAVTVIGLEVPHAHIHLLPITKESDIDFKHKQHPSQEELKAVADKINA